MAINTLEFCEKLTGELDKLFVQGPVTGFFTDNVLRSKFVGAKTVLLPEMELSGLGDYDRDTGFIKGTVTVSNQPYTLKMDRARSFQLDREDEDETGIANLAGQVLGEFVRTRVVPEVDAYCLSKLAGLAVTKGHTVTGTPDTQAFKMFNEACAAVQTQVGFDEPLVCFVNPAMWAAIQNSPELSRHITVTEFKKGDVYYEVKCINGIPLFPVADNRMKSAYTFYDGATVTKDEDGAVIRDETAGGFAPADNAQSVGLLILPKKAASLVKKTERVRTFDPSQNQAADAYKFDYRTYYDLIVKNSAADAVYAYVY